MTNVYPSASQVPSRETLQTLLQRCAHAAAGASSTRDGKTRFAIGRGDPPEAAPMLHRCKNIPSVSRAFLAAHRAYPPVRTHWVVRAQPFGFTEPMATWLLAIAPFLEHLSLDAGEQPWRMVTMDCLPELLTAAKCAPKLRELHVQYAGERQGLFHGLSFLSQVCLYI